MQRIKLFLKGSAAETAWLNHQAANGYQLTAVHGLSYQFQPAQNVRSLEAEYLPPEVLQEMQTVFQPLTTYTFNDDRMAVAYVETPAAKRVVTDDDHYRLAVYRRAREVALNWMNGAVIGSWLLMCLGLFAGAKLAAAPVITALLWSLFAAGAVTILLAIIIGGTAAMRFHRQVKRLIRLTGEDDGTWKPTFHVIFKHQSQAPDTEPWAELGSWRMAMQNQHGDYYYNLKTTLNENEIRTALAKMVNQKDFAVMSWLGLYPL
ncbi:hypothetical protein [Lactiplantibacillus plajomi]|uniref:DUF2812 domain-containing protein n=1 Tax=Lactiplantibacillus plajomi TaxID=1457217 RepID=A0ABV6K246_9LACO|nr:hypothetical protein [Lactiplantibacillus plajomi]